MFLWLMTCSHPGAMVGTPPIKFIDLCRGLEGREVAEKEITTLFPPYPGYTLYAIYNYKNYGPVVVVVDSHGVVFLRGYGFWNFASFHYRHFMGDGVKTMTGKTRCPVMFYAGSSQLSEVVNTGMEILSGKFSVKQGIREKVRRYVKKYTKGRVFTMRGMVDYTDRDLLVDILVAIREGVGVDAFEELQKIFLDMGVYYLPTAVCPEMQTVLDHVREFLTLINGDHAQKDMVGYFTSIGFR